MHSSNIYCKFGLPLIGINSFGIKFPTRPLKGISLTLKAPLIKFNHNLWLRNIYIAQRDNGLLAVGATEEEKGFDNSVRMD